MSALRRRFLRIALFVLGGLLLSIGLVIGGHYLLKAFAKQGYERELAARNPVRVEALGTDSLLVRNPVFESGQDPWIVADTLPDGAVEYIYIYSEADTAIAFKRGRDPLRFDEVEPYTRWTPGPGDAHGKLANLWAPELHRVGGQWVVYFAANDGSPLVAGTHLTYALRAVDNDPRRGFGFAGEVALPDGAWAIDATNLDIGEEHYLVWSGWREGEALNQYLFICRMADAFTPVGPRVEISAPTYDWELRGRRAGLWPSINEGPVQLDFGGETYVVYSASGSWSNDYTLGALRLTGDDPMSPSAWEKRPTPILARDGDILGPGHNGFFWYGGQLLAIYHAAKYSRAAWDREVHVGLVREGKDGWPVIAPPREEVRLGGRG